MLGLAIAAGSGAALAQMANPHGGGASPHGRGMGAMGYEPPADGAMPDPSLPPGVLFVSVRDAEGKPVPNADLVIGIVRSTVSEGESRDRREVRTGEDGNFAVRDVPWGRAYSYTVRSQRGPARFEVGPFNADEKAGMRVVLHVFDAVQNVEDARVGMQSMILVNLREDALVFDQLYRIYNLGPIAWQADQELTLPPGWKGFVAQDNPSTVQMVGTEKGAALRGTVRPGITELTFRFQVPLEGTETQEVTMPMLPRVASTRIIAEASKAMGLEADGFRAAERSKNREGKGILTTDRSAQPGELGIGAFTIRVKGLPTTAWGAWISLGLAVLAAGSALTYAWQRRGKRDVTAESYQDLVEAREALIAELAELERAKQRGDVGPRSYDRLRAAMLDALGRILDQLEAAKPKAARTSDATATEPA
jgi:hypothetical protein